MSGYDLRRSSPSTARTGGDWITRSRLPRYVGEVASVVLGAHGEVQALIVDGTVTFNIPADIARAHWNQLGPGDLVCVRWSVDLPTAIQIALAVDSLDGTTSIVSALVREAAGKRCERLAYAVCRSWPDRKSSDEHSAGRANRGR